MKRKTKKKPLTLLALLTGFIFLLILPFLLVGQAMYYFSKVIRAFSFILMLKRHSARNELRGFFKVWLSVADI